MDQYIVYILASRSRVLYVGITSKLKERVWQHRTKVIRGFTAKYNVERLVHFETFNDPFRAIEREKQLKGWRRSRKIELIEAANPHGATCTKKSDSPRRHRGPSLRSG